MPGQTILQIGIRMNWYMFFVGFAFGFLVAFLLIGHRPGKHSLKEVYRRERALKAMKGFKK